MTTLLLLSYAIDSYAATPANNKSSKSRPQWVSKGETSLNAQRSNDTYYFKIIHTSGADLAQLREGCVNQLAEYIGRRNQVSGLSATELTNRTVGSSVQSDTHFSMVFKNEFSSDAFYASLVDEWWERVPGSGYAPDYHYYALYAVSADGSRQPVLDRFEVTRSYGAVPAVLSIVPGVGQLVKGQKVKGGLMLAGAAAEAGAIILCENRRAYNATRIIEQPKFARHYNQKADNWSTGRNIAIGATAALVAWSVIDAAATPGVTRIRISPAHSFSFAPTLLPTPHAMNPGLSLTLNF